jgi:hypothetical protein
VHNAVSGRVPTCVELHWLLHVQSL